MPRKNKNAARNRVKSNRLPTEKKKKKKKSQKRPGKKDSSSGRGKKKSKHQSRSSTPQKVFVGDKLKGHIDIHPDGFGFLIAKDPELPNVYVGAESLGSTLHRDVVEVKIVEAYKGGDRLKGSLVRIIERKSTEFFGLYRPYKGGAIIVPEDPRNRRLTFKIQNSKIPLDSLKSGTCLLCTITDHDSQLVGIEKVIEDPKKASMDTMRVIMEAGHPREFEPSVLEAAKNSAERWEDRLHVKRRDLRDHPFVTIDGRDARDFDDAICARHEKKNEIRLWVAIADVSFFVKEHSVLDKSAYERATSVYFPDFVLPMLPEVLSNGVCSLNPHEDRAALCCEMLIDRHGKITEYEFYEALIQSHQRLTYESMQGYIEDDKSVKKELKELSKSLDASIELFKRLHQAKSKRGAVELELLEPQIFMNPDGEVKDIQPRFRLTSHRLIEECMLAANMAAARFLKANLKKAMYRIHEEPDPKKTQELKKYLSLIALDGDYPLDSAKSFAHLVDNLRRRISEGDPAAQAVQSLILRSFQQARYHSKPIGHFALATEDYTHFTSPIRRYPDLIVHRLIKSLLHRKDPSDENLEEEAQHCSEQERRAIDSERKLIDIKKCRFMKDKVGEEFDVRVTGLTEKGVFCQIEGHFVDGFVQSSDLEKKKKLRFDPALYYYVGPGQSSLKLGDPLRVVLAAVDLESRKIDFHLVD